MPAPAGSPVPNAAQGASHLLSSKSTVLFMSCLVSIRTPRAFSAKLLSRMVAPQPLLVLGLFPPGQGFGIPLTEQHEILIIPLLQLLRSLWIAA